MRKRNRRPGSDGGMPLIVAVLLGTGFLVAYLAAESFLATRPHPLHWAVAAGGAALGWAAGTLIYRLRGDIS